jgi:hypothetical protein
MNLKKFLLQLPFLKVPISIYRKYIFGKNKLLLILFYFLKIVIEIICIFLSRIYLASKFSGDIKNQNRQNVFLLIEKYVSKNNYIYNFDYYHFRIPLINFFATKKISYTEYYFDNDSFKHILLRTVSLLKVKPKKVIISSWNPYARNFSNPSKLYLRILRKYISDLNVNLISWDTTSLGFWKYNILNDTWIKISVTENPNLLGLHKKDLMKSNVNTILMPMNFDAINKLKSNFRNTDVFFSGRINSYRDYRNPFISVLKSIKCDLYLNIINNNTDLIPYEEIYRKLNNSKIGVNFAISTNSNQQLKGRAWETLLCGALLLEQENDQILNYFEPNIDFVFFSTPDDLKEKILFYLKNPLELSKVACSGNKKARLLQENNRFEYIF